MEVSGCLPRIAPEVFQPGVKIFYHKVESLLLVCLRFDIRELGHFPLFALMLNPTFANAFLAAAASAQIVAALPDGAGIHALTAALSRLAASFPLLQKDAFIPTEQGHAFLDAELFAADQHNGLDSDEDFDDDLHYPPGRLPALLRHVLINRGGYASGDVFGLLVAACGPSGRGLNKRSFVGGIEISVCCSRLLQSLSGSEVSSDPTVATAALRTAAITVGNALDQVPPEFRVVPVTDTEAEADIAFLIQWLDPQQHASAFYSRAGAAASNLNLRSLQSFLADIPTPITAFRSFADLFLNLSATDGDATELFLGSETLRRCNDMLEQLPWNEFDVLSRHHLTLPLMRSHFRDRSQTAMHLAATRRAGDDQEELGKSGVSYTRAFIQVLRKEMASSAHVREILPPNPAPHEVWYTLASCGGFNSLRVATQSVAPTAQAPHFLTAVHALQASFPDYIAWVISGGWNLSYAPVTLPSANGAAEPVSALLVDLSVSTALPLDAMPPALLKSLARHRFNDISLASWALVLSLMEAIQYEKTSFPRPLSIGTLPFVLSKATDYLPSFLRAVCVVDTDGLFASTVNRLQTWCRLVGEDGAETPPLSEDVIAATVDRFFTSLFAGLSTRCVNAAKQQVQCPMPPIIVTSDPAFGFVVGLESALSEAITARFKNRQGQCLTILPPSVARPAHTPRLPAPAPPPTPPAPTAPPQSKSTPAFPLERAAALKSCPQPCFSMTPKHYVMSFKLGKVHFKRPEFDAYVLSLGSGSILLKPGTYLVSVLLAPCFKHNDAKGFAAQPTSGSALPFIQPTADWFKAKRAKAFVDASMPGPRPSYFV